MAMDPAPSTLARIKRCLSRGCRSATQIAAETDLSLETLRGYLKTMGYLCAGRGIVHGDELKEFAVGRRFHEVCDWLETPGNIVGRWLAERGIDCTDKPAMTQRRARALSRAAPVLVRPEGERPEVRPEVRVALSRVAMAPDAATPGRFWTPALDRIVLQNGGTYQGLAESADEILRRTGERKSTVQVRARWHILGGVLPLPSPERVL